MYDLAGEKREEKKFIEGNKGEFLSEASELARLARCFGSAVVPSGVVVAGFGVVGMKGSVGRGLTLNLWGGE